MNLATTGVYFVEISPTTLRGFIGSLGQMGIVTGILVGYLFGLFRPYFTSALISVVFPLILLATLMMLVPESPRWLLQNKQRVAALNALAALRRPVSS